MNIVLKNVTYNKRLSQETSAYAADVWVDGVKRGSVQNSGNGGPDMFHPYTLGHEIEKYAKTLPHTECYGTMLEQNADMVLGALLSKHLATKDLQRIFKTKTLFTAADGKMYTVKGGIAPTDAVKILNLMPFDEALQLYLSSNQ